MKKPASRHVVIIGAGFGGIACARRLLRQKDIRITLVDRQNHHLFQPLLYQVATSTLAAPHIARSVRSMLGGQDRVEVCYDRATGFDLDARHVLLASGRKLHYDSLVIAIGVRTSFFGNDHWAPHVLQLKTLSHAFAVRQRILRNLELAERPVPDSGQDSLTTVVIVGGGPTGVELAGAFSDLIRRTMRRSFRHLDISRLRIILLEGRDRLLQSFHASQGDYARRHLEELGVEVRANAMVEDIRENLVTLRGGEKIAAGSILWTAGVEAPPLTKALGTELTAAGQVVVEPDLSLPGQPEVFVIGDAAAMAQKDGSPVPGVAPAAVQGGIHVAKQITRRSYTPSSPFRYLDKGQMAIVGRGSAVVDVHGFRVNGWIAWLIWLFIHIVFLVDFRSRLGVLIDWFWAYVRNKPGSRVFTSASDNRLEGAEPIESNPPDCSPRTPSS